MNKDRKNPAGAKSPQGLEITSGGRKHTLIQDALSSRELEK